MHQYYALLTPHYLSHSQLMYPPLPLGLSSPKMMDQVLDQSALDPENSQQQNKVTQPMNKNFLLLYTSSAPGDTTSMDNTSQLRQTTNPSDTLTPSHTFPNDKYDGLRHFNSMITLSNTYLAPLIMSLMPCHATQVMNSRPYLLLTQTLPIPSRAYTWMTKTMALSIRHYSTQSYR